jgi:plasmid stabilization system protein ParE
MRKVVLSKRASLRLEDLLNYLEVEWSVKVKMNFIEKFDNSIELIKQFPESSRKSNVFNNLRMHVVTEQTSIFYRFNSTSINIVTIFDNRMNPKRVKKEIK